MVNSVHDFTYELNISNIITFWDLLTDLNIENFRISACKNYQHTYTVNCNTKAPERYKIATACNWIELIYCLLHARCFIMNEKKNIKQILIISNCLKEKNLSLEKRKRTLIQTIICKNYTTKLFFNKRLHSKRKEN